MKRKGYLFDQVRDLNNIKSAIIETVRGKKRPRRFRRYLLKAEEYALRVQAILDGGDFSCLGHDREFDLVEGYPKKKRHIQAPRFFPDQIIHRALCNVIEPILLKGRDRRSYCAIKGRGTYSAFKETRNALKRFPKFKWCLKADIRKFYPSTDRGMCYRVVERKIKDPRILSLCHAIIFNAKGVGLPIGYATSPRFIEAIMERHDHAVREEMGIRLYCRYADDMLFCGANRREMKKTLRKVRESLSMNGYELNSHVQLFDRFLFPVDFVGYRFWKEGHVRVRKHIFSSILSLLHRIGKAGHATVSQCKVFLAKMAMFVRCGSKAYYEGAMKPILTTGKAKSIISRFDRARVIV